jgi:hypothetical protein
MAAKAWSTAQQKQQQKPIDEVFFQNDAVSLCLLINRRARTMRVIDFRAGPTPSKRMFVLSLGQREGVEKVYTLVERDEVTTWVKLGFAKEGNIPGFYKRSDAFLLGCPAHGAALPIQSEMRIALGGALGSGGRPADLADDRDETPAHSAAHEFAEKTLAHAKKLAKELAEKPFPTAKVAVLREADVKKPIAAALRNGRALTAFEPFGRDVERRYFSIASRGGFELIVSTESQACFGNALLELLTGPKSESERTCTVASLRAMCDKLLAEGVVSCFSLAPSDDVALATAFVVNGFRRTGLLINHMVVGGERKDAMIWSRKLANPTDD